MAEVVRPYIDAVEAKGWHLYQIENRMGSVTGDIWDQLQANGPVNQVLDGGAYIFGPHHEPAQRLFMAHYATRGIGPCMRIRDPRYREDYPRLETNFSLEFAVFSRLVMGASCVSLYTPQLPGLPPSKLDSVELDLKTGPAVFERDFDIITFKEFELKRQRR